MSGIGRRPSHRLMRRQSARGARSAGRPAATVRAVPGRGAAPAPAPGSGHRSLGSATPWPGWRRTRSVSSSRRCAAPSSGPPLGRAAGRRAVRLRAARLPPVTPRAPLRQRVLLPAVLLPAVRRPGQDGLIRRQPPPPQRALPQRALPQPPLPQRALPQPTVPPRTALAQTALAQTTAPSSGPRSRGGPLSIRRTSTAKPPMKAATAMKAARPEMVHPHAVAMIR